jgi:hypothetical protein
MKRMLFLAAAVLIFGFIGWKGFSNAVISGKLGQERDAGVIYGDAAPAPVILRGVKQISQFRPVTAQNKFCSAIFMFIRHIPQMRFYGRCR